MWHPWVPPSVFPWFYVYAGHYYANKSWNPYILFFRRQVSRTDGCLQRLFSVKWRLEVYLNDYIHQNCHYLWFSKRRDRRTGLRTDGRTYRLSYSDAASNNRKRNRQRQTYKDVTQSEWERMEKKNERIMTIGVNLKGLEEESKKFKKRERFLGKVKIKHTILSSGTLSLPWTLFLDCFFYVILFIYFFDPEIYRITKITHS